MNQFYQTSILLLLLFTFHSSFATVASENNATPNETNLLTEALAPGDLSATITGVFNFCAGSSGGTIAFNGAGGSAPYTFTYQVDGGAEQQISTSALSSSVDVPVNTSTAKDIIYRITSVKGATGKATIVDISQVISVFKAPVVDFSFTGAACSGAPVQFTPSVQGVGSYTYLWNFGDGQTSSEENPAHEFSSLGCGTASFTVSLTVTDSNGCSATLSRPITVQQKPDISFSDLSFPFGDPFNNCGSASANSPDYTISVGNTSLSSGCINSYSIDWGDGSAPVANASFPATHTYKSLGSFNMVIMAYGANGCANEITYVVKNMNNPSVGITSPGTTTNLCAPTAPLEFEIAKWGTNSQGTTYTVNYGDGSPILILTQEQLMASPYYVASNPSASANFPIPHSYILPNCPNAPYIVTLTATNACSSTQATVNNITVFSKTAPDFTIPAHACVNSSVVITNTSIPGYNTGCNQTSIYTWDFGDGTAQEVTLPTLPKNTSHTYSAPGQYTVRLITKNICGESSTTRVITIDPPLTATATATGMVSGTVTVCQDAPMQFITFTGTNGTAPYTFTYTINNGPVQSVTTAPGSNSVTVEVPTGTIGSFKYTFVGISDTSPTACAQVQTGSVTVVVAAPPSGSISGDETACLNDASPEITFTGSGGTRPYTFTYNVNGGSVQTISTSGSSNSVTLEVPTTSAGVYKYNLMGVQDSGTGTCSRAVSASATVTISQPPSPMILPNYEYCNGEATSVITFTNTVTGTTYRWTNSNTSIGLAASGNGNIPSFTARNTTGAPIVATITVTPSVNGCDGPSQSFTIIVSPSAVLFSRGAQTICSGENTAEVILTSPSGAALSWTSTAPAGITGVITSGTNSIPVQTLVNATSAPITVTYTAQAALPVTDPCAGILYTYTITVNPRPVILQAFNPEICSGNAFTVSPENNADNSIPSGTRYTWDAPVISPAGSITGAGAQATLQAAISQTLVNNTSAPATATYTVTPIANGCAGNSFTIVVTVLPLPSAAISGSATVCQDAEKPVVTFTGSNGTAPYTFSYRINSGAVQTVATEAGSSSVTVEAPTDVAGSFTYTLVSVKDAGLACAQAQSGSAVIIVQSIPTATLSGDATVCINSSSPQITFTGSGGTRPYTFTYNINGGASQSIITSATSSTVTLEVPTTTAGVFKYNLTGVQGAGACNRTLSASATVTVKELPAAMTLVDYTYCNGETTPVITFTNTVAGTTYRWTNSNTSIGLPANGIGNIPSFTALNITSSPVTSTITLTPSVNGCDGDNQSFAITVHPSPIVTFSVTNQTICSGESTSAVTLESSTMGAQFSWTATAPAGITGMITSGTDMIPVQTLVNTTSAPITVTYRAKATTFGTVACSGSEATYTITVNPKAEVKETFALGICSGSAFSVSPNNNTGNSIPFGNRYTWNAPVISPAGAITGAGAQATLQAAISQTLVNNTSAPATATYTVTPIANGCAGTSFTIVVTVLPLPSAAVSGSATVCQDAEKPVVTFTGSNGTAPYTFSYIVNNGPVQSVTTEAGSNSVTVEVPTNTTGSFIYTLVSVKDAGAMACLQALSGSVTVVITTPPSGSISGDETACLNDASPEITFTGSGGTKPYTFTYNINGGAVQTISTSATSGTVTLEVPTSAAGVFTYNLTGVEGAGACSSAAASSATVTVTGLPAAMTLVDYTYCNGETTPVITFTNAVAGTTYRWTNSNTSIGLAANGIGNISSFTAGNTTGEPIVAMLTVTPSVNGCDGVSQSFAITVHPSPIVTFSIANQTICSGESTSAVTLESSTVGAQFSWTADPPAGITGVITSGTNAIPAQTLVNTTSAPITVTYRAKATTFGTVACSGSETVYNITVNPRLAIQQAFNTEICSGSSFTVLPENNIENTIPSGIGFIWSAPVISPSGAITGASAQAIPQGIISQALLNTTSAIATATYSVTPITNGCAGTSFTIVVSVLPVPTAIVSGSATVCQDAERPLVTFTGNNGTAPYTFAYRINNGAVQIKSTDPASTSVTVEVPTDIAGSFTYTLVSISDASLSACTHDQTGYVSVVVTAPPSGTVSGNATACLDDSSPEITFTGSGGTRPYTFTYNVNGGAAQIISTSASSNSVTLAVPTTAAGVFTYNLTGVQDAGACSSAAASSATMTVTESPSPMTLTDNAYCNGETTSEITFTNSVAGTTYSWTNNNTSIGLAANGTGNISSFIARNTTGAPITANITVTPSVNGCDGASQSFAITVQPSPVVTFSTGAQSICSGASTLPVTLGSSTVGAQFSWIATVPAGITGVIESGTGIIPVQTLVNATNAPVTVTYRAKATTTGTVSCSGSDATYIITVNPRPAIQQAFNTEICSNNAFTISPQVNSDNSIPSGTVYTWSVPVISPEGAITGAGAQATPQAAVSQALVNTTSAPATATYIVTPIANGCAGESFTVVVTIIPLPSATVLGSAIVCQDAERPVVTFTGSNGTAPYTFAYTINNGPVQTVKTEAASSSATVEVPTGTTGSFTYTLVNVTDESLSGCTQVQAGSVTVVVTAPPSGTVSGTATVCSNSPSPHITFSGSGGARPYTFTYNINGGEAQTISTSGSSNSVTVGVPTTAAGVFAYNLTGVESTGACSSAVVSSAIVTVTESPTEMTLTDYAYCNGETTSVITFANVVAGTTYRWTNSNPSIGLGASGNGNIASFTALNATSSPVTSILTVIPSVNGCDGASQSFAITVHPLPVVTFSDAVQTICSGESTLPVTPGSSTSGAEFSWTADQPAGITGMITSGTGIIPVQMLVNSTSAPITVTYSVKATTTGAVTCSGSETTYTITVNPKPAIQQTFNTEICSGSAFSVSPENNADNSIPSATMYTWSAPVISPAGAITGASTQAIPQSSVSQALVNTTSAMATATYTVTPITNGCAGTSFTIVVTVLPVPTINPVSDITLCHGEQAAGILFSGIVPGVVYQWKSDNSSIGIAGSGTERIAAFTAVNTGNSPVESRITVTPIFTYGNVTCEGTLLQFTITVNPGAHVNAVEDQKVCSGNNLSIDFTTQNTGGITTYEWTNSNTAIGLSASGSGPLSFVPVNAGNTILSATITGTPVYSNNGVSCKGTAEVFTITVDPAATVVKPLDQVVCNGFPTDEIRFVGTIPNTVYQWTTDNASIGLSAASGSGDIMPFTAMNNGAVPVVATITVTPVTNGCNGTPASFTITVYPTPIITQQPEGSIVCLGEKPAALFVEVRGTGSPSYQWYSNATASTIGGTLIPNATGASYDPPADVAGIMYYYSVITFSNDDCNLLTSSVAEVTINPNPVISAIDQEISSGESFTVIPTWGNGNTVPPGTAYIWSDPVVSPANAVSGAFAQTEPRAEISQRLVNTTTQAAMVTYTVFPVSGSCTGASFIVTVYVDSPLTPNVAVTPINCFGMNNGSIITSIQGGSPIAGNAPYIILWTGPNGFTSNEASIFNLIPGVYHLTINDSRGKQFSADYTITAPEEMVVTDEKRDISCYGAADGRISMTISGGTEPYQILWTKDNAPFATTEDIAQLTPGTYAITVTDAKGCAPVNRSWVISQPEPLVLTLKGKSDIRCFGDSTGYIAIEVTGGVMIEKSPGVYGYHYLWSGPDGFTSEEKNLSNISAGEYTLQVTDGAGCTQSLMVALNEPSPLAVVTETTPISCYGANNATIRLDITGGTPPYQADWNNYATGTFQDNLSPGNYTILITDAAQCQITTTVNIPEAPVFRVNPEVKNVSCYGASNGSISLNFETTLKSVIFRWSDNSRSGTTRNNVGPGTYTVYIQGGDLCMINRTFIVTEPSPLMLTGAVTDISDCSSVDGGAIDLMVTGGTPPYRYAWSNGAVTEDMKSLQAGNYAITVSDSMGCVQVAQYTVKRPLPLEIDVKTSIDHNCATGDIKAISTAKVSGGVTPYQLEWSTGVVSGQNNEQMETRQSGIIVLTVTDQTGCTAIRSFDLEVPDPGITSQLMDCNAHVFQFNGNPAVESQATTYTWDFGDGTSSNLRNPQHAYSAAGTYKVRLTVAGAGPCVSEYEDLVKTAAPPVVGVDKDPRFCRGDSVLIYGTGADAYRWNDGTTGDSIWIKREGDYSVTGTSASGCSATYNFKASYYDLIGYTIQSDQEEVSAGANRIRLWSENIPYSNYQWDFGDGYTGQGVEVFHSYEITDDGYIDVTLTVINPNGCKEVATKRIWKGVSTIANTFTPNSDGINDIYLKGWQIEVFNRNGILMYKGDQGWDGKHDGRLVDNDTYFVIIYDSTQLGTKYKKSYVTVLR